MVQLTQDTLHKLLDYDPTTGIFTWKEDRRGNFVKGEQAGYIRADGYRYISVYGEQYLAHRLAWLYVCGKFPDIILDHINGDRGDNSIANLRAADYSLNAINSKHRSDNTSGIKGVNWHSRVGKWNARASSKKDRKHLGYFDDFFEACCARKSAEVKFEHY